MNLMVMNQMEGMPDALTPEQLGQERQAAAERAPELQGEAEAARQAHAKDTQKPAAFDDEEDELAWQAYSNCLGVDPDMFFPERGASSREAKEVCRGCVVRDECLEYALTSSEKFGIWGGMSERERRRIRRQRAIAREA